MPIDRIGTPFTKIAHAVNGHQGIHCSFELCICILAIEQPHDERCFLVADERGSARVMEYYFD